MPHSSKLPHSPVSELVRWAFGKAIFAHATPLAVHKVVQGVLRGPRLETVQFSEGQLFDCFTSEKYYWLRSSYEEDERQVLEASLNPGSVLFDVGAHVGFWEVILSSKCRHIHAFEPSPRNFDRLSRNIRQNEIQNVTLVPAAASDEPARLHIRENGSMTQVVDCGIAVEALRLDDYVAVHGAPDVVKIDIEGYAGNALKGMQRTLSLHRPILFIELHSDEEVSACRWILDDLAYSFAVLGNGSRFPYRSKFTAAPRQSAQPSSSG